MTRAQRRRQRALRSRRVRAPRRARAPRSPMPAPRPASAALRRTSCKSVRRPDCRNRRWCKSSWNPRDRAANPRRAHRASVTARCASPPVVADSASWDNLRLISLSTDVRCHGGPSPMNLATRLLLATLCVATPLLAHADEPPTNPMAVLGAAKSATGGSAWNDLRTEHSRVTLATGGLSGPVERWSEFLTGRSYLTYSIGPTSGAAGYDGKSGWTQDESGDSRIESSPAARELAVNAAYRDRLAFWFPTRYPAQITFKDHERRDDADFDVISIVPEGGREFDLWVNSDTHLIERLTEREASQTRTEYYMDFREVAGVRIPFRVRATRGDTRFDEIITIDSIDFDPPQKPVDFARPAPPAPDYTFPAGSHEVEVPFTLANGHIYIDVKLDGKGPYLMLLDAGGANVLLPQTAQALGHKSEGAPATGDAGADADVTHVSSLELGGLSLANQAFVTLPLAAQVRRIEGVDHVAGLIGYELFRRFPTRIDYEHGRIVFYPPGQWTYGGNGVRVPLQFSGHVPEVEGSLDGIAGLFEVDAGSRASLTLTEPFAETNQLADKYHATAEIVIGAGIAGPARAN